MPETGLGALQTFNMELTVTIINCSHMHANYPILTRRLQDLSICYSHYRYSVKSPGLAIILLSLLYIFSSKPGKISTHNSLASFLKTSSSVVCSEFNHILFTVMVRVKRLIISYFIFFKARLISKQMKYIGSLFILVFVCSQVSTKHFLHVFQNRWRTSLLLLLNPHLLICSTKVCLLVYCTLFYHPP